MTIELGKVTVETKGFVVGTQVDGAFKPIPVNATYDPA
jgi:hypothetical protein